MLNTLATIAGTTGSKVIGDEMIEEIGSKGGEVVEVVEVVTNPDWWSGLLDQLLAKLPDWGMKLGLALVILIVGFQLAKWLSKGLQAAMRTARVDTALVNFLGSVVRGLIKVMAFVFAVNALGVPMTSFIAILGAAGLAVGLALKDGLGNFAGGMFLLFFKPVKIGDWITAEGFHGKVRSITIFYTVLVTKAETTVTIPNGVLANGQIENFSESKLMRVQALVGIGYGDDIREARRIMLDQVKKDHRIVEHPEPFVVVKELADSSVNLEIRVWCPSDKHRRVLFELLENIKLAFDEEGISIPYPQSEILMKKS